MRLATEWFAHKVCENKEISEYIKKYTLISDLII
jgi:hypothetical protein